MIGKGRSIKIDMNHLSICTGIGGIDLAAEWAGFTTVAQCEIGDFQTKVLEKHWPHVPRWRDARHVTVESLHQRGIRRIDLLTAGYPCQPFALIGDRGGAEDPRHLWPEIRRIIGETRPTWVVCENVIGHITLGLDDVLSDLEADGYACIALVTSAAASGAPHLRERVFVVGYADGKPASQTDSSTRTIRAKRNTREEFAGLVGGALPGEYWQIHQPPVCGVDDGFPGGVDRSEALGNPVCPQQAYPILNTIMETEVRLRGGATNTALPNSTTN